MNFNLRLFVRQIGYSLTRSNGTPARLTPKRIAILLFFVPVFSILKLSSWLGFAWDDLFYKEYEDQKLAQPVFIIGNPRRRNYSQFQLSPEKDLYLRIQTVRIQYALKGGV